MHKRRSIIFRVDSGLRIGTGHLMRCLTLADRLRAEGYSIEFVSRDLPGSLHSRAIERGYPIKLMSMNGCRSKPTPKSGMMHWDFAAVSQEEDAQQTADLILNYRDPLIVVDHYGLDREWEDEVKRQSYVTLCVIDDLADRTHNCEILLDQNFYKSYQTRYDSLVASHCLKLLGPSYALLRPEYQKTREQLINKEKQLDTTKMRVLVSFGGYDQSGFGLRVSADILRMTDAIVTLMGAYPGEAFQTTLQDLSMQYQSRFCNLGYSQYPWLIMAQSDLFVGAGGTTTWERCALGLPGIIYSVSDNQLAVSADLSAVNCQIFLGPIQGYNISTLTSAIRDLIEDRDLLRTMSDNALRLVDAKGLDRAVNQLESYVSR